MYIPIPDTPRLIEDKQGPDDYAIGEEGTESSSLSSPQQTKEHVQTRILVIATWAASILFGFSTAVHYIWPVIVRDNWEVWNDTDPGLYRRGCKLPNIVMVTHLTGGVYLMFAGPIQLIPSIRTEHINLHRWIGRFYIIAAVTASAFAVSFCVTYGNGRGNPHETAGNFIMGISAFICAVQSYRKVKMGSIEEHKIWSYRLYAVILGALLYRLYVAIYYGLVLFTPLPFSAILNNSIFYLMALPNLAIVELIRLEKLRPTHNLTILRVCSFFVIVAGTLILLFNWIPSMLGFKTSAASAFLGNGGDDADHSTMCGSVSSVQATIILFFLFGSSLAFLF